ncbi:hypothetical protein [Synechococcus elongatus]|uniref:DUF3887 domain-containing protein n=1 Tax=Synechococcus elongatus PCC 11802 TaxID=2283154 RepID=A0AAT9JPJ1_SYNEL|nr:hypothetical protein [Synechococcus elongatus]QFZ92631.1 hypothetical protein EKO22_10045 [Synechococcus elongatus PCC 11802]
MALGWVAVSVLGSVGLTPPAIAQAATNAAAILSQLPRPTGSPKAVQSMFAANAYQQQSINFQAKPQKPAAVLAFYRQALSQKGYRERTINTVSGDWGFNLVLDLPSSLQLAAKAPEKTVVLVVQGTALGPDTLNVNARFEEI